MKLVFAISCHPVVLGQLVIVSDMETASNDIQPTVHHNLLAIIQRRLPKSSEVPIKMVEYGWWLAVNVVIRQPLPVRMSGMAGCQLVKLG